MDTRNKHSNAVLRVPTRADFSPIRTTHSTGRLTASASLPTPTVTPSTPVIRLERVWPEWHRGPLDRLQPMLTRFRD